MADTTLSTERVRTLGPRPGTSGWKKLAIAGGIAIVLAGAVYAYMQREAATPSQPAAAAGPQGPTPSVMVASAVRAEIRPVSSFTGRVQAIDKVELRARIPGYLEKQLFQDGAQVEAGQLMFVIEQPPYVAEVTKIKGQFEGAKADLENAKAEFGRQNELVRKGYSTPAKFDEARSKLGQAQGEVDRQQAALEQAQLNLGYTEVRTPFSGQVGQRAYSVGNYVTPASGNLATVVSRDPMFVMFPVTQRELLEMRRRAEERGVNARAVKVRVQLADGSIYDQVGEVDFVDVEVNQATDSINVRAKFPNPKGWLIDGQLVTVQVESATSTMAMLVPQQALQFDQSGYFVLTVDPENRIKVQPVGIAGGYDTDVQITTGLKEGDRVVVEGVQKVRPNQLVQAVEKQTAAPQ